MKKNIILPALLAMFAVTSCSNTTERKETTTEKTVVTHDSIAPDGTTIKMNDQGIIIEHKDGSKKDGISVSKDSASIQISNPKK